MGDVLLAGGGLALFIGLTILVVSLALSGGSRTGVSRGLHSIDQVYAAGGTVAAPEADGFSSRVVAPMSGRVTRIGRQLTPGGTLTRLRRWLNYAGNPPFWTVDRIFSLKGIGLLALGVVGALAGLFIDGAIGAILGGLVGAVMGYYVPDLIIYQLGYNRQELIRQSMPDVLDILTVSVEAGLGFDAALAQVARYGRGPLVGEFARSLQEMQIGLSRVEAMRALAPRTRVIELRTFCSVVVQASELGVPIATVLREQAKEMRVRRRQRAEEIAQKIPVKILFPLIFCLFPSLFIVVIGPGVINIINGLDMF
ncbi:type II secretion system F family protein [Luedemannella helvata]|uniref:Type II secretion system F family protein n=1 Tax=Luedemannella helvata TaxID=349315 RepID=A0ABN2JR42_9ACTN